MSDDFQKKVQEAIANPKNLGEMKDADSIGTVGSADCGDMLRLWLKFKEEGGKKIIDKATFQSFGCETAIAAASLATELIRGKTADEALNMSGQEMAKDLGPLPPTKIHCTQMVEDALRSALTGNADPSEPSRPQSDEAARGNLLDSLKAEGESSEGLKVVFLDDDSERSSS